MIAAAAALPIDILPEVAAAIAAGAPVVALESTIVAHGMPYPQNAALGAELEEILRATGAVPATIAVLGGRIRVGLDRDGLETLARGQGIGKASSRDLAAVVVAGSSAGTTVSATMRIAALVGIRVFATGVSAASIAERPRRSTYRPISRNWPRRRSPWSAPGRNRSWTSRARWRCWRRCAFP